MGGLVDENIIPNLTLNRAKERKIRTARLPIAEFCTMDGSAYAPVLSINQVFDCLMAWRRTKSWHAALRVALPERKGFVLLPPDEIEQRAEKLLAARRAKAAGGE